MALQGRNMIQLDVTLMEFLNKGETMNTLVCIRDRNELTSDILMQQDAEI
jgi:hypothetical protein